MAKFRIRFQTTVRDEERDPRFGLSSRRFDYAVNGGDVISQGVGGIVPYEFIAADLNPGDVVTVQIFNIASDGRESEPAELEITIPEVVPPPPSPPPPELPVPSDPTFVIEEQPEV